MSHFSFLAEHSPLLSMGAKAAIWIVSEPHPEHVAAITWLNENNSAQFYMLKVEVVRIGESLPAPLFTLIVGPSEESTSVGKAKKEFAERYEIRHRWWTQLIERSSQFTKLQAGGYRSPEEEWPSLHDRAAQAMERLDKALQPFIKQLKPGPI